MTKDRNKLDSKFKNFWLKKSKIIDWQKPPKVAVIKKLNNYTWYNDGLLNIYENCITKHIILKLGSKVAITTIDNEKNITNYTYEQIDEKVNLFINFLYNNYNFNKKKKLKMMIHSSASLESAITMLACSKLGIHFSVIFEELEEKAIISRINLFHPHIFFTRVDKKKFIKKFKNKFFLKSNNILFYEDFKKNKKIKNINIKNKLFKSNNDFFTLFTSGSTGIPKGVTHSTGGYMVYAKYSCKKQFGMNQNSIVLTASDAGWINGHTYSLFGPLSFGATTILLESPLLILDKNLLKKILFLKVDILYLPVTIIRMMKSLFKNSKLIKNTIKVVGSMGEPLAPSIGAWYVNFFGKKNNSIVNTYFQTETAGIICSPRFDKNNKLNPHGSVGNPLSKFIKINQLDELNAKEIKITTPWPGCMKNILNGKKEWNKYWDSKGNFRLFDLATKKKNNIYIHGRVDDVMNIRGHRIGSEEIESIVLRVKNISECCAVAIEDKLEGSKLNLFVISSKKLSAKIEGEIFLNFGSFAIPKNIYYLKELPKTRSGKILRRLLRSILIDPKQKFHGDITTMLNPKAINDIKKCILKNDQD